MLSIAHDFCESGSTLPKWFWLRVSHEVVVKTATVAASSEDLTGTERSSSKMVHSHGRQVGAGYWQEASSSPHEPIYRALECCHDSGWFH